jgi:hypothetical protein
MPFEACMRRCLPAPMPPTQKAENVDTMQVSVARSKPAHWMTSSNWRKERRCKAKKRERGFNRLSGSDRNITYQRYGE